MLSLEQAQQHTALHLKVGMIHGSVCLEDAASRIACAQANALQTTNPPVLLPEHARDVSLFRTDTRPCHAMLK